ncbi:MAG: CAAX prenyl protease-related protein [Bryobacteraceae bacterium]
MEIETTTARAVRWPSVPYVLPFAVFAAFLVLQHYAPLPGHVDLVARTVVLAGVLGIASRSALSFRLSQPASSILLGIAVFALWIAPDALFPHYRQSWLFNNGFVGTLGKSIAPNLRGDPLSLVLRSFRAIILVPIIEELFWRAWLMRWLINPRFETVPLGAWASGAFWITAVLFASEHGPYWDVGLLAGVLYNWWMIRTKSLGDCILAHAVTNACLSAYVIVGGHWEYWQ